MSNFTESEYFSKVLGEAPEFGVDAARKQIVHDLDDDEHEKAVLVMHGEELWDGYALKEPHRRHCCVRRDLPFAIGVDEPVGGSKQ